MYKVNIHVELTHIIENDGNSQIFSKLKNIFDKGSFSRSEESRQNDDFKFSHGMLSTINYMKEKKKLAFKGKRPCGKKINIFLIILRKNDLL